MPQGPAELHEKWEDDGKALRYLESQGIKISRGGMIIGPSDRDLTEEESSAVTYLCLEWDYGYVPQYKDRDYYIANGRIQDASR